MLIRNQLEKNIIKCIDDGYRYFGLGGALGFYTLSAETIIKLKERYPYIKLMLVLPCISQTIGWMESDIRKYNNIKLQADRIVCISKNTQRTVCSEEIGILSITVVDVFVT